jgi:site-specific DNA-methyltransferase (adenine-specific)
MSWTIHHGDCREVMATLDAASVDAIVCDPPYGLSFMGKGWDHGVPGVEFWTEALRVAKPGAHLLAFGGTRTYHRLACAIEDASWEIRDCVMWVYGSGFPKSHDVSKAIDKAAGAEREVELVPTKAGNTRRDRGTTYATEKHAGFRDVSAPATDAARQWSGWGTALKPACEPIIVARKPLCGTVAENVLTHGTGAINVDGCRVASPDGRPLIESRSDAANNAFGDGLNGSRCAGVTTLGRWPANLIHDGSEEVVGLFPVTKSGGQNATSESKPGYAGGWTRPGGKGHHDCGSAARFFYCAKASKADRGGDNKHPTVKPTDLMCYLCRLVTPPGGVVLDPFTGSGSTGKAAMLEGFRFIGIEREAEYVEIAKARIAAASGDATLF